jgi:hypothetical protein
MTKFRHNMDSQLSHVGSTCSAPAKRVEPADLALQAAMKESADLHAVEQQKRALDLLARGTSHRMERKAPRLPSYQVNPYVQIDDDLQKVIDFSKGTLRTDQYYNGMMDTARCRSLEGVRCDAQPVRKSPKSNNQKRQPGAKVREDDIDADMQLAMKVSVESHRDEQGMRELDSRLGQLQFELPEEKKKVVLTNDVYEQRINVLTQRVSELEQMCRDQSANYKRLGELHMAALKRITTLEQSDSSLV